MVRIYRSDANAEHFLAFGTALDGTEITAETLNGAMDGLIFENGAAFNTVTADKDGHIRADLNDAFAAQVRSLGTSGEYFLVGGIVNTLLDAFDGTEVMLTVNGAPLEADTIFTTMRSRAMRSKQLYEHKKRKACPCCSARRFPFRLRRAAQSRKLRHSPRRNPRRSP